MQWRSPLILECVGRLVGRTRAIGDISGVVNKGDNNVVNVDTVVVLTLMVEIVMIHFFGL